MIVHWSVSTMGQAVLVTYHILERNTYSKLEDMISGLCFMFSLLSDHEQTSQHIPCFLISQYKSYHLSYTVAWKWRVHTLQLDLKFKNAEFHHSLDKPLKLDCPFWNLGQRVVLYLILFIYKRWVIIVSSSKS